MADCPGPCAPWLFRLGVLVAGAVGAWIFAPGDALARLLLPWWLLGVACMLAGWWLHALSGVSHDPVPGCFDITDGDDLTIPLVPPAIHPDARRDPLDDLTVPLCIDFVRT